jgi:tRNA(Leu) C34 or U34 (ribose-2'-O)-methylase TrmL
MRAAGCYQADQIIYNGNRYAKAAEYHKHTLQTDTFNMKDKIPLLQVESFISLKDSLESIPSSAKIICVDLVEGATPLPHFVHPDQAVYIFGPEDGSIDQTIIDKADDIIYVPTIGCMNLSASVIVLLYDRLIKAGNYNAGNILIRENRDTNNRLIDKR